VDDEPWARKRLSSLFRGEPDCEVIGECADGAAAVDAMMHMAPDVVCLDVQMPDMSGFDVLDAVMTKREESSEAIDWPLVIFVTAYDRYAVAAFERDAADYLLKPFDDERFRQAIERVRRDLALERDEISSHQRAVPTEPARRQTSRMAIRTGGRVLFVRFDDVSWFEADGNYVTVHVGRESYLVRESMTRLAARLDPDRFVRVHRSAIVNLDRVKELQPWVRGEQLLLLDNGTQIAVGRAFRRNLEPGNRVIG
jgi:two-component system, LytTR family, response regulator